jgi:hypothetical protein
MEPALEKGMEVVLEPVVGEVEVADLLEVLEVVQEEGVAVQVGVEVNYDQNVPYLYTPEYRYLRI